MCDGDLDAILSHISSKINKIFCDREFVGCVKEDLEIILGKDNCCVLFPKLKPIFLRVLRYQAVISDLSVFCIGRGPNQVAVVCKKLLKEKTDECPSSQVQKIPESMDAEENSSKSHKKSSRINRPTQSYYVPPAQRCTSKKKTDTEHRTSKKVQAKSASKLKDSKRSAKYNEETASSNVQQIKVQKSNVQKENDYKELDVHYSIHTTEQNITNGDTISSEKSSQILINTDLMPSNKCEFENCDLNSNQPYIEELPQAKEVQYNIEQHLSLEIIQNTSSFSIENASSSEDNLGENSSIASSQCATECTQTMDQKAEVQNTDHVESTKQTPICAMHKEEYIFDATEEDPTSKMTKIMLGLSDLQIVAESIMQELTLIQSLNANSESTSSQNEKLNGIVESLKQIALEENIQYEENQCVTIQPGVKELLKRKYLKCNILLCTDNEQSPKEFHTQCEIESDAESLTPPPSQIPDLQSFSAEQQTIDNSSDALPLYISYNDNIVHKKSTDCDIDNEQEEMQRAIEHINWKRRPLIKHVSNDDTLRINEDKAIVQRSSGVTENKKNTTEKETSLGKSSNVASWEDMFDEDGDLQPEYVEEIVKHIGCDVKVVKASHDYSAYQNTKYQDLEHVIELYDFPTTFKTQDLMQLYRSAYQDAMYIKWCDDTHALLVLSSPALAKRALQIEHDIIKARPLSQASAVAALTASSTDLKPAMKRPQTNMQTARRLITSHLGTKSKLSKEEAELERQALRDAREQRRLERQNEKDAWEGRPRNAKT